MGMKRVSRDDDLPHQIRLFWHTPAPGITPQVAVGCICRMTRFGQPDVMGYPGEDMPWFIYNDPDNHSRHSKVPFDESWQRGPSHTRAAEARSQRKAT